jgi:nuclear protein localization family protein 4
MLIRLRTKDGTKRLEVDAQQSLLDLRTQIEREYKIPVTQQKLSAEGRPPTELKSSDNGKTLNGLGLQHGDMLLLSYDGNIEDANAPVKTAIVGGNVTTVVDEPKLPEDDALKKLRDVKMQWKMEDFMAFRAKLEFKISPQKQAHCARISMPTAASQSFSQYMQELNFLQKRFAFLYGFVNDSNVEVEAIYEPPQEGTTEQFLLLDDPRAAQVQHLVESLGMQKVGVLMAHFPRSAPANHPENQPWVDTPEPAELIEVARQQLEVSQTDQEAGNTFVFVSVTQDHGGNPKWEAYQASDQLVDLVKEDCLAPSQTDQSKIRVREGRTFLVENKPAELAEVQFFFNNVAITQHEGVFRSNFPASNRLEQPTAEHLRMCIKKNQQQYVERIRDFHLLLFVSHMLHDESSLNVMCDTVLQRDQSSMDGFEMLLNSLAGIDS